MARRAAAVLTLVLSLVAAMAVGLFAPAPAHAAEPGGLWLGNKAVRLADTRLGNPVGRVPARGTVTVTVADPADTTPPGVVTLNVTAVDPSAEGYLSVFPGDASAVKPQAVSST